VTVTFDTIRGDFQAIAARLGIAYVRKADLRINPLRPPPGCPLHVWFQTFAKVFCETWRLQTASFLFLLKVLVKCHEDCKQAGRFSTLLDVAEELGHYAAKRGDAAGYAARILEKLEPLLMVCPEYRYESGFSLVDFVRAGRSSVWQCDDAEDIRGFFILLETEHLYRYLVHNSAERMQKIYVMLDEPLHLLRTPDMESGLDLVTQALTQFRALGVVLIVCSQMVTPLNPAMRSNPTVVVAFRNQDRQVSAVRTLQGLNPEQMAEIHNLPVGRASLTVGGDRLTAPVLVDFPRYPDLQPVSPERLDEISQEAVRPFLPDVKRAEPPEPDAQQAGRAPNQLPSDQLRCLRAIATEPETIDDRYDRLGSTRDQEQDARKPLVQRGLVQCVGTLGNKRRVFGLTPKGEAFCRAQGWPLPRCKSAVLHEAARRKVKRLIANAVGHTARLHDNGFANIFGNIQADLTVQCAGGQLIPIQIADRNKQQYEVKRLIELCTIDAVDHVVSVAVNATTNAKLEKELTRQTGGTWPDKLTLMDFEEALTCDWTWILEREV